MASESTGRAGGICEDMYGDQIEIVADGDAVRVSFWDDELHCITMRLEAEQREQFQRLFMEAERQAEAWAERHSRGAF